MGSLSLSVCWVPPVINCESSCFVPDVFNFLSTLQTWRPLLEIQRPCQPAVSELIFLAEADWGQALTLCCCLLFLSLSHSQSLHPCLCFLLWFPALCFNIAFDLSRAARSPITMSSCAVIYSSINVPPLAWLWDQGGWSSHSNFTFSALASGEHITDVQRKHHTVQQQHQARLPPPSWKLWLD